jgi:hypothetical protein
MTNTITVHRNNPSHTRSISVNTVSGIYTAHAVNGRNGDKGWIVRYKGQDIAHAENIRMVEFAVRKHLPLWIEETDRRATRTYHDWLDSQAVQ